MHQWIQWIHLCPWTWPLRLQSINAMYQQNAQKPLKSRNELRAHQCLHFKSILQKRYANLASNTKCLLCLKTFDKTARLWIHIGNSHGKLDKIHKQRKRPSWCQWDGCWRKMKKKLMGKCWSWSCHWKICQRMGWRWLRKDLKQTYVREGCTSERSSWTER